MKEKIYRNEYDKKIRKMVDKIIDSIKSLDWLSFDDYRELSSVLINDVVFHESITLVKYFKHGVFFPTKLTGDLEFRKLRSSNDLNGLAIYSIVDDFSVLDRSYSYNLSHIVHSPCFAERRHMQEFVRIMETMVIVFNQLKTRLHKDIEEIDISISNELGFSILINIAIYSGLFPEEKEDTGSESSHND